MSISLTASVIILILIIFIIIHVGTQVSLLNSKVTLLNDLTKESLTKIHNRIDKTNKSLKFSLDVNQSLVYYVYNNGNQIEKESIVDKVSKYEKMFKDEYIDGDYGEVDDAGDDDNDEDRLERVYE